LFHITSFLSSKILGFSNGKREDKWNVFVGIYILLTTIIYIGLIKNVLDLTSITSILSESINWINYFFITILTTLHQEIAYVDIANQLINLGYFIILPTLGLALSRYGKLN
jgi:hypothetical protein